MPRTKSSKKQFKNLSRVKARGRGLKIKVIGVGGAGCSTVSRLIKLRIPNLEFIAINTDAQSLIHTSAHKKIRIGKTITKGLGTGMEPSLGQQAAENSRKEILEALRGADLIFLTAGLGGGTGSGALPVITDLARELGILTIALVTKPFIFEGLKRMEIAEQSLKILETKVDTLIPVSNEQILKMVDRNTPLLEAFAVVDNVLKQAICGITDIVNLNGVVNVDLADLKTVLKTAGPALLGIGEAEGEARAVQAVKVATESPLFDLSIKGAKGIVFIVTGGPDLTMHEVNEAAKYIAELANPNCRIIFGAIIDEAKEGKIKVTIIATGFTPSSEDEISPIEKSKGTVLIKPEPIFEEKIEIPALIAKNDKQPQKKETGIKIKKVNKSEKFFSEDELEVPAFLRKKK